MTITIALTMLLTPLSLLLFMTFSILGMIHFYWLFGGKWGLNKALPTKEVGEKALEPPKIATAIVGLGLISFGFIYFFKSELIHIEIPNWILVYGCWIIPSIFIVRAIGDFNYVGLFKKIKNTEFAKADTKWFVPLCLSIGILGFIVQLLEH